MYLNKAIIIGNLTRDPELKALPSGTKVVSFSVATNRRYKDKDGAWQEQADFHNIVAFGVTAENTAKYLRKGSQALVEGRIQTRSWDGTDGKKQYRTEIVADFVQFGAKPAGSQPAASKPAAKEEKDELDEFDKPEDDQPAPASGDINPDDILF